MGTASHRYVSQQGIAVVTASSSLDYDREDVAMFQLRLDDADMKALDGIQQGNVRTCNDCWTDPCRKCQAALRAANCTPWSGGSCVQCVSALPTAALPAVQAACGSTDPTGPAIYKACVNN